MHLLLDRLQQSLNNATLNWFYKISLWYRYGLPVNFQAMLLRPNKKNTKRLRDVLQQLYGHLDSSAQQGSGAQDVS